MMDVVVQHTDLDPLEGLSGLGIIHHAMHTVADLLHVGQHAVVVIVPEVGQLRGGGSFDRGALHRDLAALPKGVHIILTATRDGVPSSAIGDTVVIGVRHISG